MSWQNDPVVGAPSTAVPPTTVPPTTQEVVELENQTAATAVKAEPERWTFDPLSPKQMGYKRESEGPPPTQLSHLDRIALAQADNPQEMKKYLSNVYGEGNVKQDKTGQIYVTKDGKRFAIKENSVVDRIIGTLPELLPMAAGATEGATLGAPLGPWGIGLGAVGGAIVGGVAGKTMTELGKMASGRYEKTPTELAGVIKESAKGAAVGEVGGRALVQVGSNILRGPLPRWLTQVTDESQQLTERTLAGGGRPQMQSAAPGLKRIQFIQAVATKAVGQVKSQVEANAKYVADRMKGILQSSGMSPVETDVAIKELATGESRLSSAEVGGHIKKAVQAHQEVLKQNIAQRLTATETMVDKGLSRLDTLTRRYSAGELGIDVPKAVQGARKDFGTAMSKVYSKVDQMVGGQKLVPTALINKEAQRLYDMLPDAAKNRFAKELSEIGIAAKDPTDALLEPVVAKGAAAVMPKEQAFKELADAQRGKPEVAMRAATERILTDPALKSIPGNGPLSYLLEHVGDITHRMSEKGGYFGAEFVAPKVEAGLRHIDNPYGSKIFEDWRKLGIKELQVYANAHRNLKVYNEAQRAARDAAVAVGELQPNTAIKNLQILQKMIDDGTFKKVSQEYHPNFERPATTAAAAPTAAPVGVTADEVGKISFGDAQRLRTLLNERAQGGLVPGVTEHEFGRLAQAVEHSIQMAGRDPAAAPALRLLNRADSAWASGIKKFKDTTINKLVSDMKSGLPVDPEVIAKTIIQPGYEARVVAIKGMVGPEVWKGVVGADYSRMVLDATNKTTNKVNGVQLLSEVTKRGKLMNTVYGSKVTAEITELAKTMAARDGELPIEALRPGAARQTIERLRTEQKAFDDFMKKNALSTLADPRQSHEAAYEFLVNPHNASHLEKAIKMMGEGSPEVAGIRQAALKELLTSTKMEVAGGKGDDALLKALAKYTDHQKSLLFPNGMADDLQLLGKEVNYLMKNLSDESKASFAAGGVLSLPVVARIPIQVGLGFYQMVFANPSVIRYLALGLRQPSGPGRIATRETIMNLLRYGAIAPEAGRLEDPNAEPMPEQPQ